MTDTAFERLTIGVVLAIIFVLVLSASIWGGTKMDPDCEEDENWVIVDHQDPRGEEDQNGVTRACLHVELLP